MKRLESSIQSSVINWAKKTKLLRCDKLSSGSRFQASGLPDYIIWIPGGKPLLIEFKAEGAKPTELQQRVHEQLRGVGYEVQVIDNVGAGRAAIEAALEAAQIPAERGKVPAHPRSRSVVPRSRAGKN